jgi:hypothetical protein
MIRPCIHPRCNDGTGNKELTDDTMCRHCRRWYRRELTWLVEDYVILKSSLASYPSNLWDSSAGPSRESFGHPAEWASDTCRDIADLLDHIKDELESVTGKVSSATAHVASETVRVNTAYRYLSTRFDLLVTYPDAEATCGAIHDTHKTIRRALGYAKWSQRLPVPCPTCNTAALVRTVGLITCGECSRVIREDDYPMFTRIALDYLIDAYDDTHAQELA